MGDFASILIKVRIPLSLQSKNMYGIMIVKCKADKTIQTNMCNIIWYNTRIRKVHKRGVTVRKVTKRCKKVVRYNPVQYICREWGKLVRHRAICTVNKHNSECTVKYSTKHQLESMLGADRYPHVAAIVKLVKCCKNVVMRSKRCKIRNIRNVSYVRKEKIRSKKIGKVSCILWNSPMSPGTTIKSRNSKYYKSTVRDKPKRYIGAAGRQIYIRCGKTESIEAYVDVKIEGRERREIIRLGRVMQGYIRYICASCIVYGKKAGRGVNVLIVYGYWVHEDPLLMRTGSIEQVIEWKAASVSDVGYTSHSGDMYISVSVKMEPSGKEGDQEMEGGTGSIEQVVEWKAASASDVGYASHSGDVYISVSVKMEPSGKGGDQEMEMNRVQHGAPPGEFLRPSMSIIPVNRCPKYIMCDDKYALFDLCPSNKYIIYVNCYFDDKCALLDLCPSNKSIIYVNCYFSILYIKMCVILRKATYMNRSTEKPYSTVTNFTEACDCYVLYSPVDIRYMYSRKVTRIYTCNTRQTGLYWGCMGSNWHCRYGE